MLSPLGINQNKQGSDEADHINATLDLVDFELPDLEILFAPMANSSSCDNY